MTTLTFLSQFNGSLANLTVSSGGSLNSTFLMSLGAAVGGNGTLTIQNGDTVTNYNIYIGEVGADAIIVDRGGSCLNDTNEFFVGKDSGSNSTVTVQNSGTATGNDIYIGQNRTGATTVDGIGSSLKSGLFFPRFYSEW